jgi:hypothetical protein
VKADSALSLRRRFKVAPTAKIILNSATVDSHIETYWKERKINAVAKALARLEIWGITVPNYSFFEDAPRTHTFWQRERMRVVAEEFSEAGLNVIPHLNAATELDWSYWRDFLRHHNSPITVAKEFQTGLSSPELGLKAIEALARLQDALATKRLHPILIGGGRYLHSARRLFDHCTVIDSIPFMRAMHRQTLQLRPGGRLRWQPSGTKRGEPLDDRLAANISSYEKALFAGKFSVGRDRVDPRQLELLTTIGYRHPASA